MLLAGATKKWCTDGAEVAVRIVEVLCIRTQEVPIRDLTLRTGTRQGVARMAVMYSRTSRRRVRASRGMCRETVGMWIWCSGIMGVVVRVVARAIQVVVRVV